jgi:hypothetical protein
VTASRGSGTASTALVIDNEGRSQTVCSRILGHVR